MKTVKLFLLFSLVLLSVISFSQTKSNSTKKWYEKNGIIYFSVISDGTTGPQWIARLQKKSILDNETIGVLYSAYFKPTKGVKTEVAILKSKLFTNKWVFTNKLVCAEAKKRNLVKPSVEIACLIREYLLVQDIKSMGLNWIQTMHEPIKESYYGYPRLLIVGIDGFVDNYMGAAMGNPEDETSNDVGFAFRVPTK